MKLYYDTDKDELVEVGSLDFSSFIRDERGNISTFNGIDDNLILVGDIYDEPFDLPRDQKLRLSKIIEGEPNFIIEGFAREGRIEEGLRFIIQGRGFNYYSTNLVVSAEYLARDCIVFYTLSGSQYMLDLI